MSAAEAETTQYTLDKKAIGGPLTPISNSILVRVRSKDATSGGGIILPEKVRYLFAIDTTAVPTRSVFVDYGTHTFISQLGRRTTDTGEPVIIQVAQPERWKSLSFVFYHSKASFETLIGHVAEAILSSPSFGAAPERNINGVNIDSWCSRWASMADAKLWGALSAIPSSVQSYYYCYDTAQNAAPLEPTAVCT